MNDMYKKVPGKVAEILGKVTGRSRQAGAGVLILIILIAVIRIAPIPIAWIRGTFNVPIPGNMILKTGSYAGTADDKNATFTMTLDYETFNQFGWTRIPILPVSVAVSEVTLNGRSVYLYAGPQWYEVITKRRGKGTIEAKFSMKVREDQGTRSLSFQVPRTTATSAEIELDGKELDVNVTGSQHKELIAKGPKTLVKVTYPPVSNISLTWNRARPELEEKDARLYSETDTVCSILEGLLRCNTVIRYSILRSWINGLKLTIPKDVNVLSVTGSRIRDWKIVDKAGQPTLEVEFTYKAQGNYQLNLLYEKSVGTDGGTLVIPAVISLGVEREKGHIGVESLTNVEVTTDKTEGIVAIDVDELPSQLRTMTALPLILGYKYVEQPYTLSLNAKRHEDMSLLSMIADSALHTVMMTSDGRRLTRVFYSLRNNGNQFMTLSLPKGSELWGANIAGKTVNVMKGDDGKLLIPLMDATRGSGYVGVEVIYAEEGSRPDPKRGTGDVTLELPALLGTPTIHLMCELYLPREGKYAKKTFVSDAKMVKQFSSARAAGDPSAPPVHLEQASRNLRNAAQQRLTRQIKSTGGTPVSIRLPLDGQLFRFEKTLVLEEKVKIAFKYTGLGKKR